MGLVIWGPRETFLASSSLYPRLRRRYDGSMNASQEVSLTDIRPARLSDAAALESIRRHAILVLAKAEMGEERAVKWAMRSGRRRIVRAIEEHEVRPLPGHPESSHRL